MSTKFDELPPASSTVYEIGCTHRHHDVLYDDIISADPFKFRLANQKAWYINSANQSPHPN